MNAARSKPLPRARLEEAADWWARIQDAETPPEDISEWLEWLDADPDNRDAFERIQELGLRLRASAAVPPRQSRRWHPTRVVVAVAATVLLVTGAAVLLRASRSATVTFSTPVAAMEQAPLPDGSRISLGGATDVDAYYTRASRDIDLRQGEAYFEVRHEPTLRPFIVNAGNVSIRAVGTAFNVRKTHDRITVTVTEGRVQVRRVGSGRGARDSRAALAIGAGEQAIYDTTADQFSVATTDAHRALRWREHELEFVDEPLDSVIETINRYSERRIEVRDVNLHQQSYTGTFRPEGLDEWLIAIGRSFPVAVDRDGETVVIRRRP